MQRTQVPSFDVGIQLEGMSQAAQPKLVGKTGPAQGWHKACGSAICRLITTSDFSGVVGVLGGWGSGKSTIKHALQQALQQEQEKEHTPKPKYSFFTKIKRQLMKLSGREIDTFDANHALKHRLIDFNAWSFVGTDDIWAAMLLKIWEAVESEYPSQYELRTTLADMDAKDAAVNLSHSFTKKSSEKKWMLWLTRLTLVVPIYYWIRKQITSRLFLGLTIVAICLLIAAAVIFSHEVSKFYTLIIVPVAPTCVAIYQRVKQNFTYKPENKLSGFSSGMNLFRSKVGYMSEVQTTIKNLLVFVRDNKVHENGKLKNLRLVLLIDDLDRCYPAEISQVLRCTLMFLLEPGAVSPSRATWPICGVVFMDPMITTNSIEVSFPEAARINGHRFFEKVLQATISIPDDSKQHEHVCSKVFEQILWHKPDQDDNNFKNAPDILSELEKRRDKAMDILRAHFTKARASRLFANMCPREVKRVVNSTLLLINVALEMDHLEWISRSSLDAQGEFDFLTQHMDGLILWCILGSRFPERAVAIQEAAAHANTFTCDWQFLVLHWYGGLPLLRSDFESEVDYYQFLNSRSNIDACSGVCHKFRAALLQFGFDVARTMSENVQTLAQEGNADAARLMDLGCDVAEFSSFIKRIPKSFGSSLAELLFSKFLNNASQAFDKRAAEVQVSNQPKTFEHQAIIGCVVDAAVRSRVLTLNRSFPGLLPLHRRSVASFFLTGVVLPVPPPIDPLDRQFLESIRRSSPLNALQLLRRGANYAAVDESEQNLWHLLARWDNLEDLHSFKTVFLEGLRQLLDGTVGKTSDSHDKARIVRRLSGDLGNTEHIANRSLAFRMLQLLESVDENGATPLHTCVEKFFNSVCLTSAAEAVLVFKLKLMFQFLNADAFSFPVQSQLSSFAGFCRTWRGKTVATMLLEYYANQYHNEVVLEVVKELRKCDERCVRGDSTKWTLPNISELSQKLDVSVRDLVFAGSDDLVTIAFNDQFKDIASLKEICDDLSFYKTVQTLCLWKVTSVDDHMASALGSVVEQAYLTTLDLHGTNVSDEVCKAISSKLKENKRLQNLDLGETFVGSDGGVAVGEMLKDNNCLLRLTLGAGGVDDRAVVAVAAGLQKNSTLKHLDLRRTLTTDQGGVALARALRSNTSLQELVLQETKIGDGFIAELVPAIRESQTLRVLDVSGTSITNVGAAELGRNLQDLPIEVLDLSQTQVGDAGVQGIATGLSQERTAAKRCKLLKLDLRRTIFGDEGAKALAHALLTNTTLRDLDVSRTKIQVGGARELASALSKNRTITTVSLPKELKSAVSADFDNVACDVGWVDPKTPSA